MKYMTRLAYLQTVKYMFSKDIFYQLTKSIIKKLLAFFIVYVTFDNIKVAEVVPQHAEWYCRKVPKRVSVTKFVKDRGEI